MDSENSNKIKSFTTQAELQEKLNQLYAMEFILSSVLYKLGEMSEWMETESLPGVIDWIKGFNEQMNELKAAVRQEELEERFTETLQEMMDVAEEEQAADKEEPKE
jgi:hypothetical protein